jgi:uncharacterized BrkB/YihY/UPF0761 family membrane protein
MTSLVNKGPSRERLTRRIRLLPARPFWELLTATFWQWLGDDPFQLAAALAFYTFFSLAPLLIIVIAITGLVFGQEAAQNQIVGVLRGLVGLESAIAIQELIRRASTPRSGLLATAGSVVTLLIGTGGVLGQLQASLNKIWGVAAKPWGGVLSGVGFCAHHGRQKPGRVWQDRSVAAYWDIATPTSKPEGRDVLPERSVSMDRGGH